MKPVFLADYSSKLTSSFIKKNRIFLIESDKSLFGQIVYTLDLLSNNGSDLIYLASHEYYESIVIAAKRINELHVKNTIHVIDISTIDNLDEIINSKNFISNLNKSKGTFCSLNQVQFQA